MNIPGSRPWICFFWEFSQSVSGGRVTIYSVNCWDASCHFYHAAKPNFSLCNVKLIPITANLYYSDTYQTCLSPCREKPVGSGSDDGKLPEPRRGAVHTKSLCSAINPVCHVCHCLSSLSRLPAWVTLSCLGRW